MATMVEAIMSLVPGADPLFDFAVVDHLDGKGPNLQEWRRKEPRPTDEQIAAEMQRLAALPPPPRKPTLDDLIAVLTPEQHVALEGRLAVTANLRS
jgi:XkdW protein